MTERLGALDTFFWLQDRRPSWPSVEVVTIWTFAGPAPSLDEVRSEIGARLERLPRFRQRVVTPRSHACRPHWRDDPRFAVANHVLDRDLPAPGGKAGLLQLANEIFACRLDRARPPWCMWRASGLEGGRWALIFKFHHVLLDGGALLYVTQALFGGGAGSDPKARPRASALRTAFGDRSQVVRHAFRRPPWVPPRELLPDQLQVGTQRHFDWLDVDLEDFDAIRRPLGGTFHDVLLAVVVRALQRWLGERGISTQGSSLVVGVPLHAAPPRLRTGLGNETGMLRLALPLDVQSAPELILAIATETRTAKAMHEITQPLVSRLFRRIPSFVFAAGAEQGDRSNAFNITVSSLRVAGGDPALLGRPLVSFVQLGMLTRNRSSLGLACVAATYEGRVAVSLAADVAMVPDLPAVTSHLEAALADLRSEARAQPSLRPGPTSDAPPL